MLSDFLSAHRQEILERSLSKIRGAPASAGRSPAELLDGLSHFFDQVVDSLRKIAHDADAVALATTGAQATAHGLQRFQLGFDVEQLVRDYGSLCDAITEAAEADHIPIEVNELRVLNQSLDTGIAEAVNAYLERRDLAGERQANERFGFIAHELRNALTTSLLSLRAMRSANLSVTGRTGDVLDRSLQLQKELIDYLVSNVRPATRALRKDALQLTRVFDEVHAATAQQARIKGIRLLCAADSLQLEADRLLLMSALTNLTLNAIKFTRAGGRVVLRGRRGQQGIRIEVEDECGGLPDGDHDELFHPFVQRSANQGGLELGLTIARQSIEAHGGQVTIKNLPERGCVFVVQLPG
jgi:signal transduction histidine kinase